VPLPGLAQMHMNIHQTRRNRQPLGVDYLKIRPGFALPQRTFPRLGNLRHAPIFEHHIF
jgi:hypothetical protein